MGAYLPKQEMWARAIAMWAFRQDGLSYAKIGALFGKSRSTVMENYLRCHINEYLRSKYAEHRGEFIVACLDHSRSMGRVIDLDDTDIVWLRSHTIPGVEL